MNIKKFSDITGVSPHTLRYYEKIGIIRHISRNSSGHRSFTDEDILWVAFITRLKKTGMPLDKIKEYADLRKQGDHTANSRMKLLEAHASYLKQKIDNDKKHLIKLKEKIDFYKNTLE